jgi:FdrA protein
MICSQHSILQRTYRDSVVLMELSSQLSRRAGVSKAAVMMGTPANIQELKESGLFVSDAQVAPDDVIVAVAGEDDEAAHEAVLWAVEALKTSNKKARGNGLETPTTQSQAAARFTWRKAAEEVRLALISVPGPYAAAEARKALRAGRHVFLFSDHVSIEEEAALKREAKQRNLLVMGPEAGTSILSGVPLGFANVIRPGPVGLVAASGSGLQEVSSLIDRLGSGITHAIGTGGRDLSPAVGGLSMLQGIDLLLADAATRVLVLLSKPPDANIAQKIYQRVAGAAIPVIVCFLGTEVDGSVPENLIPAHTLEEAALKAVRAAGKEAALPERNHKIEAADARSGVVHGLYSGGTLAYEAMIVLQPVTGPVWSNKPLEARYQLAGNRTADAHLCLDLGAEEYTAGVPHPMIDPSLRNRMLVEHARDAKVKVILLDFVLGYGSHPDPAGAALPAIEEAQKLARKAGRKLFFVASVTGTHNDPQNYEDQAAKLEAQHVIVAASNASAARLAGELATSNYE